jgi:hypothetical protein
MSDPDQTFDVQLRTKGPKDAMKLEDLCRGMVHYGDYAREGSAVRVILNLRIFFLLPVATYICERALVSLKWSLKCPESCQ